VSPAGVSAVPGAVPAARHMLATKACIEAALARERLSATAVGCQTALPHARLSCFDGVAVALAVAPGGNGELTHAPQFGIPILFVLSVVCAPERDDGA
jgi:hypothetical protein